MTAHQASAPCKYNCPMITLTEQAIDKLKSMEESTTKVLRIEVVGGGCSGMSYKLSWVDVDKVMPSDTMLPFENGRIAVAVDSKSMLFLNGLELDHSDGLNGTGFVFNNPNARRSCGCGSSFST